MVLLCYLSNVWREWRDFCEFVSTCSNRGNSQFPHACLRQPVTKMTVTLAQRIRTLFSHSTLVHIACRCTNTNWKISDKHNGKLKFELFLILENSRCWRISQIDDLDIYYSSICKEFENKTQKIKIWYAFY